MRRREFITLLGGAAWPVAARAQQPERMPRIGVLSNVPEDDAAMKARFVAFRQELERLGWLQSRNVHIETRFGAVTPEQIHASASYRLCSPMLSSRMLLTSRASCNKLVASTSEAKLPGVACRFLVAQRTLTA